MITKYHLHLFKQLFQNANFSMKMLLIPLCLAISSLSAQESLTKEGTTELEALTIESTPLSSSTSSITQAWSVLSGDELEKAKSTTIAETLVNQPGIHQTFFGPSANRPIIRGLDKHRVRILQNGVDTFDFSASSEDHAIAVDPMLVERIELLRGSSALLYGSNAIGGAVNVIDRTIPNRSHSDSPGAVFRSSYHDVNNGWNAGALAYADTEQISFQMNGFARYAEDYESPEGLVANSRGESQSYGLGGSYLWQNGYAGLSFSQLGNLYGVPGAHAVNETRVELDSDRVEMRSEIDVQNSDWLRGIELNLGYGDYRHDEIAKKSDVFETFSSFFRKGFEARTALIHQVGDLHGALGFQGLFDELKITGKPKGTIFSGAHASHSEAITSEDSRKLSIFLIEEFELNESTQLNGGIRWEHHDRKFVSEIADRDDSMLSVSSGFSRNLAEGWNLSANLNYTERAPETTELYSNGPHHGSETFDIGNPSLATETAIGVEVILRRNLGNLTGQLTAFQTQFEDFIYTEDSKAPFFDSVSGEWLNQWKYTSADASFRGLEAEIDWLAMENAGQLFHLSVYADLLRAENENDGTYLPRIPPARMGIGFKVHAEKYGFGLNFNRVSDQNRVPEGSGSFHYHGTVIHYVDPPYTAGYTLLNAFYTHNLTLGHSTGEFFVRGNNLTDELAKVHTSFLKTFAPLPGRSFEIGLKVDF